MFAAIRKLFRKSNNRRTNKPLAQSRRVCLQLEALEGREVPTVAFLNNFGPESIAAGSNYNNMQNPAVNLIFAGSWGTQGVADQTACTSAVNEILRGPYLSGLTQYGSDGHAQLGFSLPDANTVQGQQMQGEQFSQAKDRVQTFINSFLNQQSLPPGNNDAQHEPIYVVILDPTDSGGNRSGWNDRGTFTNSAGGNSEGMHMIFMGTGLNPNGAFNMDNFTNTFSHELVESLTDGILVKQGSTLPTSLLGQGNLQIADNEPDHGAYVYRLEGNIVQAYWSVKDDAYIVPDGSGQRFNLVPSWNSDNTFSGTSALLVEGDQFGANYNDVVTLNQGAGGGLVLGLNVESAAFEPGQIDGVLLNTAGGANTVKVYAVPSAIKVVALFSYNGTDNVTIGAGGSLSGIMPGTHISVDNLFGQTSLTINGSKDGAQTVSICQNTVAFEERFIGFSTHQENGQTTGVTSVTLYAGAGSQVIASAISPSTTFYLWWAPGETVSGPDANKIHLKYLPVPISWYYSVASYTPVMTLNY